MSILNKQLNDTELATLELFLQGALAPLTGYLSQQDHHSVLQHARLANGYLWPLPFTLQLTSDEKRQAQRFGRIALVDDEQRIIAEVDMDECYRLAAELNEFNTNADHWYISGTIRPVSKVLHPAFNRIRHDTNTIKNKWSHQSEQPFIAIHTSGELNPQDMLHASTWLAEHDGSILLQVNAPNTPQLHEQMRELRQNIRRQAAQGVTIKLSLLPEIPTLTLERQLLLQARIAKNYGATGFLLSASVPKATQLELIRHRDELGLDLIPAKRSSQLSAQRHGATKLALAA